MDTTPLRDAYRALLDAGATVAACSGGTSPVPPAGEWNAEQILAHVSLGDALCALGGAVLSEAELGTLVPTRLLSKDTLLVDQPMSLRHLITGLATTELPAHTQQLLALLPDGTAAEAAT